MSILNDEQIEEIRTELNSRGKIAAVKLYKAWAKCSLQEAKVAVEGIGSDEPIPKPQRPGPADADQALSEIDQAIAEGNKVEAITRYRELTGLSLIDSAQFVESRMNEPRPTTLYETSPTVEPPSLYSSANRSKRSGCFYRLLLFVGIMTGSTLAVFC